MMGNSASQGSMRVIEELLLTKTGINDALTVEALLTQGVNPNCVDEAGNTPLHIAATEGHITVLSLFLNTDYLEDINLHARNNDTMTAPMCAAINGHATALRMILEKSNYDNTLFNDQNSQGTTPLAMTAIEGHAAAMEILLSCDNILLDEVDESGRTALHCAVLYEQLEVFWMLLAAGADPWIHDHRKTTPLMSASIRGFHTIVKALLDLPGNHQTQVNAVNCENFTAMHMAVRMDFIGIAETLIQAGADLNVRDNMGLTPVMWAAQYGRQQLTEMLIKAGCDPSHTDKRGRNVLHHAAFFGWTEIVKALLLRGMDCTLQSASGNTPIILAIRNNNFDIIKVILDYNSDINVPLRLKNRFTSLLMLALERGREDICELLYKAGCILRHQDVQKVVKDMHPIHPTGVIPQEWIDSILRSPRSLQDACRIAIRNCLSCNLKSSINELPIPFSLQNFLSLNDVPCQNR